MLRVLQVTITALGTDQGIDQGVSADSLQNEGYMFEEFIRSPMPFKPIVDGGLVEDPFLPEEPLEMIRKGNWNKVILSFSEDITDFRTQWGTNLFKYLTLDPRCQ